MQKKTLSIQLPIYKQPTHKSIYTVLLEDPNSNVYPKFDTQYLFLNDSPIGTNMHFIPASAVTCLGESTLNTAKAIIISGAYGHVSERKDLDECFKIINNVMALPKNWYEEEEKTRVVGFCFAFQKQLTLLGGKIDGDLGQFKQYIKQQFFTNDQDKEIRLYMAHQYFTLEAPQSDKYSIILSSNDMPNLGFLCSKGTALFLQGHPECSIYHVEKMTKGKVSQQFKENKNKVINLLRWFIAGYNPYTLIDSF